MKYGWEAHFTCPTGTEWKYLVKVHLNRTGTLFIEAVDLTSREGSAELLRNYLADLLAMLVKETNR